MKRSVLILTVFIVLVTAGVQPAAAQNRYIVRTTGGLTSVLNLCLSAGCQVQGSLDGQVGQTFLVTSTGNLISNLLNGVVNLLEALLGIKSIEPVGLYAVRLVFDDGHNTGLYTWSYLYEMSSERDRMWARYLERLAQAGKARHPEPKWAE